MSYADVDYYKNSYNGTVIPDDQLDRVLRIASRHIDTLTYNRIVGRGISNLTEFQQHIIEDVCCELADFEYENADLIGSVLQSYSINGASMSFGASWNVKIQNGVAISRVTYQTLAQTGLCCRLLR